MKPQRLMKGPLDGLRRQAFMRRSATPNPEGVVIRGLKPVATITASLREAPADLTEKRKVVVRQASRLTLGPLAPAFVAGATPAHPRTLSTKPENAYAL